MFQHLHYTGTQIHYYFVCHRQLWLFSHHLEMEQESDFVQLGKIIHETSYEREAREIELERIKLDWLDVKDGILHEVKKTDTMEEAHEWQVLYYLYYLKDKGFSIQSSSTQTDEKSWKGEINYPKLKKTVEVILTPEKEKQIANVLEEIERIVSLPKPPSPEVKFSFCKKCSYCDLCYS